MPRESKSARQTRLAEILQRLLERYPDARCELDFESPFQLLVATILAAQCTDAVVNRVTPTLFKTFPDPRAFVDAKPISLEEWIRPTGAYRNKAKSIKAACELLLAEHDGEVPAEMDALVALPGVGRKTANVVLGNAFGVPGLPVDTHVLRISYLLGMTESDKADEVEQDLCEMLPKSAWTRFAHLIQWHGRRCCKALAPDCEACVINDLCPSAFAAGKWANDPEAAKAASKRTLGHAPSAGKVRAAKEKAAARKAASKKRAAAKNKAGPKKTKAARKPADQKTTAKKKAARKKAAARSRK